MFINQAAEQFRLWTGIEPSVELMEKVAKDML
jgi:shikimate 5-dehydrogenase